MSPRSIRSIDKGPEIICLIKEEQYEEEVAAKKKKRKKEVGR